MTIVKCKDCKYMGNCPCGYSYANAACLTIQKKSKLAIEKETQYKDMPT